MEDRKSSLFITKQMRKDRKDVSGIVYIKEERDDILTVSVDVTDCVKRYFDDLLNTEKPSYFEETIMIIKREFLVRHVIML